MKIKHSHIMVAFALLLSGLLLMANSVYAQSSQINLQGGGKTAVQGYDVMGYWNNGKPLKGNPAISFEYMGAQWHFASTANRDAFAANPAKYAPQYGGYCAYAASQGYLADVDVNAWSIHDDKLYLNYSLSVRSTWLKDKVNYITQGDANWPGLVK